ncbi:MAG: GNAT family N-acetyltransferase [Sedimenticola sp.]
MGIDAPTPLKEEHDTTSFDCDDPVLDDWLKRIALKNEDKGSSRTFAVCEAGTVIGYYALATGSVERNGAPGKIRRNMPDPIPVMVLGRLVIDKKYQSQGVGRGMLKDAILRVIGVAEQVGVRAILVHAISDEAKLFYMRQGFRESPTNNITLMITLEEAVRHTP